MCLQEFEAGIGAYSVVIAESAGLLRRHWWPVLFAQGSSHRVLQTICTGYAWQWGAGYYGVTVACLCREICRVSPQLALLGSRAASALCAHPSCTRQSQSNGLHRKQGTLAGANCAGSTCCIPSMQFTAIWCHLHQCLHKAEFKAGLVCRVDQEIELLGSPDMLRRRDCLK